MKQDNIIMIAFVCALIFVGIGLIFNSIKMCDVYIDYDVTADINHTEAVPNIAEIKLACYKLCVEQLTSSDIQQNKCFDKCENIGSE